MEAFRIIDPIITINSNKKKNNSKNKISQYNKTMIDIEKFKKFPIGKDKSPLVAWTNPQNLSNDETFQRAGIPCGSVNKIVVVDIDDYDMAEDNPFIQKFGKDYDKKFNTFIVKTTSGGKHIYFNYEKTLDKTAHNNDLSIDFQSSGSYVVSPDSDCYTKAEKHLPVNKRKTCKYSIIKNKPITDMPAELKEFIIKELYSKDKKQIKNKIKTDRQQKVKSNAITPYYTYNINKQVAEIIANDIDSKLYQSYNSWWKIASAFKEMGYKDIFLKYSIIKAPAYKGQEDNNEKLYDSITSFNEHNLVWLIKQYFREDENTTETNKFFNTYKCKDIYKNPNHYKPDEIIDVEKLGFGMTIEFDKDYIIKSDTGTGKTTITKEFLRTIDPQYRFISITARISLAAEQYRVFRNADLSCKYYEDVKDDFFNLNTCDSLCICVNSINMLKYQDFSNTILFLDEYNSLIEDVFCSPTMKDRIVILKILINMISTCKNVICVDADIQDHTLEILKFCGRTPHYIKNQYLHNKGNTAIEWEGIDKMIEDIKTKDAWLICSDSKTNAETVFKTFKELAIGYQVPLDKKEKRLVRGLDYYKDEKGIMVCITAKSKLSPTFSIDDFDRVLFSPKIIYGLDGSVKRDVYCIYEEKTISPRAMNQQVNRCRNINSLNYSFLKNKFTTEKHVEMSDIYEIIEKTSEYTLFENYADSNLLKLYKKTSSIIQYNNDSFNTNKKAHFVERLKNAGWIVQPCINVNSDKAQFEEQKKSMKDDEYSNFDEIYKQCKSHIDDMNKYFKIPENKLNKYKHLFLGSQITRDQNLNLSRFMFKSNTQLKNELKEQKEFNDKKFKSSKYKVAFLQEFMIECGCQNKFQFSIGTNNKFTSNEWNKVSQATKKKYELMFKPTKQMMQSDHNPIIKMFDDLFGKSVTDDWSIAKSQKNSINAFLERKTNINGKSIRIKTQINPEFINHHLKLIKYRFEKEFIKGEMNLKFGEEDKNFKKECFIE